MKKETPFLPRGGGGPRHRRETRSSRGHSLGDETLEGELLLLEIIGRRVLNLELAHSFAERLLDLLLLSALHLERQGRVGNDVLDARNVRLELLLGLELLAEGLVVGLERLGVCTSGLAIARGKKTTHAAHP